MQVKVLPQNNESNAPAIAVDPKVNARKFSAPPTISSSAIQAILRGLNKAWNRSSRTTAPTAALMATLTLTLTLTLTPACALAQSASSIFIPAPQSQTQTAPLTSTSDNAELDATLEALAPLPTVDAFEATELPILTDWPQCPRTQIRQLFEAVTEDIVIIDAAAIEAEVISFCAERSDHITQVLNAESALLEGFSKLRARYLEQVAEETETLNARRASLEALRALEAERAKDAQVRAQRAASSASQTPPPQPSASNRANTSCPTPRPVDRLFWSTLSRSGLAERWRVGVRQRSSESTTDYVHIGEPIHGVTIIDVDFATSTVTAQDCAGVTTLNHHTSDGSEHAGVRPSAAATNPLPRDPQGTGD